MSATKEQLARLLRPLLVKWITRGVLWLLTAKLGLAAVEAESPAGEIGAGLAAAACLAVSLLIDRWHHRQDLAQPPSSPAQ